MAKASPSGNTATIENYLKAVHALARESPTGEAGMKAIAAMVGVTIGTASTMVKRMAAARLVRYERFGGVRLTTKGTRAAVDVIRRHRLIETFLVRTLKLDWSVVHDEAERLEHALSPVVIEALDAFLGHPVVDPHGDPIPDGRGRLRADGGVGGVAALTSFKAGDTVTVRRIADQRPEFLHFVAAHGLRPGMVVKIIAVNAAARSVTVRPRGGRGGAVTLGSAAAADVECALMRE